MGSRPRAADDFTAIRARMEELRRERQDAAAGAADRDGGAASSGRGGDSDLERQRRRRVEGWPPPWAPTIFVRRSRR